MQGVTDQRQAMALNEAIGDAEQEAERLRERVGAYESQAAERAKGWAESQQHAPCAAARVFLAPTLWHQLGQRGRDCHRRPPPLPPPSQALTWRSTA